MNRSYKAIAVDDEQPALNLLIEFMQRFPQIELCGQCKSGTAAREMINQIQPDLVFLDVQMPGLNGFQVLQQIKRIPKIVFVSAYERYAIKAFEVAAVDYLLKPYDAARFDKAVKRALSQMERSHGDGFLNLIHSKDKDPARLFVKQGRYIYPVDTDDILYIQADGDYAQIHCKTRSLHGQWSLGQLESMLPKTFIRIHRSVIVNSDKISHLEKCADGGMMAHLNSEISLRVSRSNAANIRNLL